MDAVEVMKSGDRDFFLLLHRLGMDRSYDWPRHGSDHSAPKVAIAAWIPN